MLTGGDVVEWLPLMGGTLHPHVGGLPSIQASGWQLMGVPPGQPTRVFAVLATHHWESEVKLQTCVKSLLSQSLPIEALMLAIPLRLMALLPPWLHAWRRRHPRIRLRPMPRRFYSGLRRRSDDMLHFLAAVVAETNDTAAWLFLVDATCAFHALTLETLMRFAAGTPGSAVSVQGKLLSPQARSTGAFPISQDGMQHVGPILDIDSGLLVQHEMLKDFRPPPEGSSCSKAVDVWIAAHFARRRIRRAFIQDRRLRMVLLHRISSIHASTLGNLDELACMHAVPAFPRPHGDLWKPLPRVVLCAPCLTKRFLQDATKMAIDGAEIHSIYACSARSACESNQDEREFGRFPWNAFVRQSTLANIMVRWVDCGNAEPPEHAVMRGALLRDREASTVMFLPPTKQSNIMERTPFAKLISCALAKFGYGFCEQEGWTAVTVAALACFNSDDEGVRRIYQCSKEYTQNLNNAIERSSFVSKLLTSSRHWNVGQKRLVVSKQLSFERRWRDRCPNLQRLGSDFEFSYKCTIGRTYGCLDAAVESMWIKDNCKGLFRVHGQVTSCKHSISSAYNGGKRLQSAPSRTTCLAGSLPRADHSCDSMIVTTFLTTRIDWQRGKLAKANFGKLWNLYESTISRGFNTTVIFDKLPSAMVQRYQCGLFRFHRTNLSSFDPLLGINDVRFFMFYELIRAHPEWRVVFLVDAFDVRLQLNPCPYIYEDILYIGSEGEKLKDNPWLVLRFHDLGGKYNSWFRTHAEASLNTLNCGIIGGFSATILALLKSMTQVLSEPTLAVRRHHHQEINVDMAVLNYVAHTEFAGKFVDGPPVHSEFKQFQSNRTDVWFIHK